MQMPGPTDTSRLAHACETWLLDHLDCFRVPWDGDTHDVLRRLPMYAEITLLAVKGEEVGTGRWDALRRGVVDWIAQHPPHSSSLASVVTEFPQAFIWAGTVWQNRERLGLASGDLRAVIETLVGARSVRHFERHVGHDICVCNVLAALHGSGGPDLAKAYGDTLLGHQAWDTDSDTVVYFICHDIFFLSDWGSRPIRSLVEPLHPWLGKLHVWYEHLAAAGNIDLAAELFIALSYLEERPDIGLLERSARPSIDACGLPQMPKGQGSGYVRPGDDQRLRDFFRNYHTVIVCLLAALTDAKGR